MKATFAVYLVAGCVMTAGLALSLATHSSAQAAPPTHVSMVIVPGTRLGPDHKLHDAFTPTDLTAMAGETIVVTVYNYDTGPHSFMAPALRLNVLIPAARRIGVPAVKVFTFSVRQAGVYYWHCMEPCDDAAKGWAMSHLGYMAGTISIQHV